jgi:hypothetical protein
MPLLDRIRYAASEIYGNYERSNWWRNRITDRIIAPSHRRFGSRAGAVHVIDEDWDNFLVLDACRLDLFEETIDLTQFDEYRSEVSLGSRTDEWTYENFHGRAFGDTVYVTGSPVTSKVLSDEVHELLEVWKDGFDEEKGAILPSAVAAGAREAHAEYPNKRLIVHFMQPHIPFVDSPDVNFREWWTPYNDFEDTDADPPRTVWGALGMGLVEYDEVWDAYKKNLRYGFEEAIRLAEELPGKTVITSDHGNMMGERTWPVPIKMYAHPRGLRTAPLVEVPWAVIDDGDRPDIVDDGVTSVSDSESDEMKRKLAALGYHDE